MGDRIRLSQVDTDLEMVEALGKAFLCQSPDLFVRVPEPSDRGGVGRVSPIFDVGFPGSLSRLLGLEDLKGFGRGEGVGDVSERGGLYESV